MKNKELFYIFRIAALYITTIIGAGFATGQELVRFFLVHEKGSFFGITLAGILFAVVGAFVLERVYNLRIANFDEFLLPMTGWHVGCVVQIISTIFILSVFCIMIAGSASILSEVLGISAYLAAGIMGLLCMFVLLADIRGLVTISLIVSPLLIIGIITSGVFIIINNDVAVFSQFNFLKSLTNNWFWSAIIYVSYNSIISINILCSLRPYLKSKKTAIYGGLLGGAVLCVIALIMNYCMFIYYPDPLNYEFPFMEVLKSNSSIASLIYECILWLAMTLSAITSGYCIIDRISRKFKMNMRITAVLTCALAVPLSTLGFSRLISVVYPVFGYLGLFIIIMILINGFRVIFSKKKRW